MNKKGFTLLELLAVIVILSVLAVITIPIILNMIDDARIGSYKDSVLIALRSSDLYSETNGIDLKEGINVTDLNLKNNDFTSGTIILNNGKLEAINVTNGEYCATGSFGTLITYKGECDTEKPLSPSVTNPEEYTKTVTYTLAQNGEIISGIDYYEYYLSDDVLTIDEDTTPTGMSNSNEITIDTESNYVYFRIVSVAGNKGYWTTNIENYVDKEAPSATTIDTTTSTVQFTITDDSLAGYKVTTELVEPTTWIEISGTSYDGTYTPTEVGTYYLYMKDYAGKISHATINVTSLDLVVIENGASISSKAVVSNPTVSVSLPYIGNTADGRTTSTTKTSFTLNDYSEYTSMEIYYTYVTSYSYGEAQIKFNGVLYHSDSSYSTRENTITVPITSTWSVYCYNSSNIGYAGQATFNVKTVTLIK